MLRSLVVLCGALAVAGCGGSNDPSSGSHGLQKEGESCRADSDCVTDLVCLRGVCTNVSGTGGAGGGGGIGGSGGGGGSGGSGPPACRLDSDCAAGEVCDSGSCVSAPPASCDPFAQDCPAGQMCVLSVPGPDQCVTAGSASSGSPCAQPADCAAGLACAALAGSSPTEYYFSVDPIYLSRGGGSCMPLCHRMGADCGSGAICAFISGPAGNPLPDTGVCYVP
jgi:Cys-rich repeat protein